MYIDAHISHSFSVTPCFLLTLSKECYYKNKWNLNFPYILLVLQLPSGKHADDQTEQADIQEVKQKAWEQGFWTLVMLRKRTRGSWGCNVMCFFVCLFVFLVLSRGDLTRSSDGINFFQEVIRPRAGEALELNRRMAILVWWIKKTKWKCYRAWTQLKHKGTYFTSIV